MPRDTSLPMNYIERIGLEIWMEATSETPESGMPENQRLLWNAYALLCLTKGVNVTDRDVHDAWSLWAMQNNPDHPSLKPFDELDKATQALDDPYVDAIRQVARDRMPEHDESLNVIQSGQDRVWFLLRADVTSAVFEDCPDEDIAFEAVLMSHLERKMFGWGVAVVDAATGDVGDPPLAITFGGDAPEWSEIPEVPDAPDIFDAINKQTRRIDELAASLDHDHELLTETSDRAQQTMKGVVEEVGQLRRNLHTWTDENTKIISQWGDRITKLEDRIERMDQQREEDRDTFLAALSYLDKERPAHLPPVSTEVEGE